MDKAYVLGTGDDELARLGLQHRVWRDAALDAWTRAGFGPGHSILDLGCGPGYATLDLAERVARVVAVDQSRRFLDALREELKRRRIGNVELLERDAQEPGLASASLDGAWSRWLLSFVADPAKTIAGLATALRPGASAVFHEYGSYGAMRTAPPSEGLARLVAAIQESWRRRGGCPDIALKLPELLTRSGFEIRSVQPLARIARPGTPLWEWPDSFFRNYAPVLERDGFLSGDDRRLFESEWSARSADPDAFFFCPVVIEVVARRR